jgi:hypothetical protein
MSLWYLQEDSVYYHLGAYNNIGYKLHASFGLFRVAIAYFTELGLKRLNLGAGAGVYNDSKDGLTQFKRGWSTGTALAYLCGRIFDKRAYLTLSTDAGDKQRNYFPRYRQGEFS